MSSAKANKQTAVAYLRVSRESQVSSGLGLAAQKEQIREYAKRQGLRIRKYFTDAGVSGAKGVEDRPALNEMLTSLKDGETVLVFKRDRISRDAFLSMWVERKVNKINARIESVSGEGNGDSPADEMMRRIIDAFSQYEREQIRTRTKVALAKSTKALGQTPYGFQRVNGKFVKCPETYPIRERIIKERSEGKSYNSIATQLNKDGIKTLRGKKWQHIQIMNIWSHSTEGKDQKIERFSQAGKDSEI